MCCLGNDVILVVQYEILNGTNNIFQNQTVYGLKEILYKLINSSLCSSAVVIISQRHRNFLHEMEQNAGNRSDSILASDTVYVFIPNYVKPLSHDFTNTRRSFCHFKLFFHMPLGQSAYTFYPVLKFQE